MNTKPHLTKQLILSNRLCARRAWLEAHQVAAPAFSAAASMLHAQGQEVHAAARTLFAGAKRLSTCLSLPDAIAQSRAAIDAGCTTGAATLNATLGTDTFACPIDAIEPASTGVRLIEFASGVSVKDEYIDSCAIDVYAATTGGLTVQGVDVIRPSSQRVRDAGSNGSNVLVREPITDAAMTRSVRVPVWIADAARTLAGAEPCTAPGEQCTSPSVCPFRAHCGSVDATVTDTDLSEFLPSKAAPIGAYIAGGASRMHELPSDAFDHPRNALVKRAVDQNGLVVTRELADTIAALPFPRVYLDFESIAFALPRFAGTRAYQQIPFQFSAHIERSTGAGLEHREFLDFTGIDPRRSFAHSLLDAVGTTGPILVFSAFEATRIAELALILDDLRPQLLALLDRLVDLLPLVRRGFYHPDQRGSWSLKAIAPVCPSFPGIANYTDLQDVADGLAAQAAYMSLIDPADLGINRPAVAANMLAYCAADTANLYRVVQTITTYHNPWNQPPKPAKRRKAKANSCAAA